MSRAVLWFRRDLRLADNPALLAALADHDEIVPLFVVDPRFTSTSGVPRDWPRLDAALTSLDASMGGALVVRVGDPTQVLPLVAAEVGATDVYVTKDFAPYGRRRDASVAAMLRADSRRLRGVGTPYAVEPGVVRKGDGGSYAVFTPFSRAWLAVGWERPQAAPASVTWVGSPAVHADRGSGAIIDVADLGCVVPSLSEAAAGEMWDSFRSAGDEGLDAYEGRRNDPSVTGTSRLSAALRWGVVHPRQLLADLAPMRSHDVFRSELAWRDFYASVLFERPETARECLNSSMAAMPVDVDARARERFGIWCRGETGYPIVDAGMRQLLATGWMHNRVRMITASFLVKDLHLPWQWGARHFMRHLIDGDLASNSHGWQWTAGTGTDAAPYFRVFNPVTQGERYDPTGAYVRQWIPALADVRDRDVHAPWRTGVPLGYVAPMVDHAAERVEALARYASVRRGP